MDHLTELENKSIYIIRESYNQFDKIAALWSVGKDSTTLIWLCMKAFFGQVPFPVVYIDTSFHFQEMYDFRDYCVDRWDLDLIVARNDQALAAGMGPENKLECCTALKTQALKDCIAQYGFEALLLGIRRDEHGIRAKERYFSPRDQKFQWDYENQPPELWDQYSARADEETHIRVHPLLHWREVDIWRYIQREGLEVVPLYFAADGMRYRSLGCQSCCAPVASEAATVDEIIAEIETSSIAERAGRAQDKEDAYTMQKLRALGYM
ncbi:MAG: sulfate adenylyltransferase subunit 2 [Planctomycetes bacterium]|nr:sulfate adenylyltransferase subunit 2 [Planctomycetota bacterium]